MPLFNLSIIHRPHVYWLFITLLAFTSCNEKHAKAFKLQENQVTVHLDSSIIKIIYHSHSVVQVLKTIGPEIIERESLIINDKTERDLSLDVFENRSTIKIISDSLKTHINKDDGSISFFDQNENKIASEARGGSIFKTSPSCSAEKYSIQQLFDLAPEEGIYGLGQHQLGHMNYRGEFLELVQDNTTAIVPFFISSNSYGILWDNYSHTRYGNPKGPRTIPSDVLFDKKGQRGGLSAEYYNGLDFNLFQGQKIDSVIDIDMNFNPQQEISDNKFLSKNPLPKGITPGKMSVRWKGEIEINERGTYRFFSDHDDGMRLWIADSLVINAWEYGTSEDMGKVLLSDKGKYPIVIEWRNHTWKGNINLKWLEPNNLYENTVSLWSEVADQIDYYFIHGNNSDSVISGYRQLTGRTPLFGKWAYGLWQSKEHYSNQEEILSIAKEYRKRKIPLDNIVQDWFYWNPKPWGSHAFNSERYPDPEQMIRQIHNLDLHFMISVWPKFEPGSNNFEALKQKGFLFDVYKQGKEKSAYYDAFNPEAREMYWNQLRDSFFVKGVDAWWLDATEPEISKPLNPDSMKSRMDNYLGSGAEYLNAYSLMSSKGVYEEQRKLTNDKRVFILTRSAFAGQQRYGTTTWSGDISASWNVLRKQISAGLNFSISGLPYWTSDIGGFFINYPDRENSDEYKELFTRWFQFGAFCPIFRVHGTHLPREMWMFGEESYNIQLRYTQLRYRLLPYIYSLAGWVTFNDYTIMRPLVMDFPEQPDVYEIDDQYMFGSSFLVCPVTKYQSNEKSIFLPENPGGWYDFWNGEHYTGGKAILKNTPLSVMPLFVRAGSIVPMGPVVQNAMESDNSILDIRIYPGSDGSFLLYEDAGDGYQYEEGEYSTIKFDWKNDEQILKIGKIEGNYPEMKMKKIFKLTMVASGQGTGLYSSEPTLELLYTGTPKSISLGKP